MPHEANPEVVHVPWLPLASHWIEHVPGVGGVHMTVELLLVIVIAAVPGVCVTDGAVQLPVTVPHVAMLGAVLPPKHVARLPIVPHVRLHVPVDNVHG